MLGKVCRCINEIDEMVDVHVTVEMVRSKRIAPDIFLRRQNHLAAIGAATAHGLLSACCDYGTLASDPLEVAIFGWKASKEVRKEGLVYFSIHLIPCTLTEERP